METLMCIQSKFKHTSRGLGAYCSKIIIIVIIGASLTLISQQSMHTKSA